MSKILGYELGTVYIDLGKAFTNAIMKIDSMRYNDKKLDLRDPVALAGYDESGCFVDVELQKRRITLFFNCGIRIQKAGSELTISIDDEHRLTLEAQLEYVEFQGEKITLSSKKAFRYKRDSAVDACMLNLVVKKKSIRIPFKGQIEFHLHQTVEAKKGEKFPDAEGVAYNYLEAFLLQDMGVIALHPETKKPWPYITLSREAVQKLQDDRLAQLEAQWREDCDC